MARAVARARDSLPGFLSQAVTAQAVIAQAVTAQAVIAQAVIAQAVIAQGRAQALAEVKVALALPPGAAAQAEALRIGPVATDGRSHLVGDLAKVPAPIQGPGLRRRSGHCRGADS